MGGVCCCTDEILRTYSDCIKKITKYGHSVKFYIKFKKSRLEKCVSYNSLVRHYLSFGELNN